MFNLDLQMFAGMYGGASGFTGGAPAPAPVNPTPQPAPAPAPAPTPSPTPTGDPGQPGPAPQSGGRFLSDAEIRSMMQSAQQTHQQEFQQQHAKELQMAQALAKLGYTPDQIIAQAQEAALQQQSQQTGMTPQAMQYFQGMQTKIDEMTNHFQRQEGMRLLGEQETALTEFGKKFGIDYATVQSDVRNFARTNGVSLDVAFKVLNFDKIGLVQQQQGQAAAVAAMQGRGAQPIPMAAAGTAGQSGPIDWTKVSSKDFQAAKAAMRNQG